MSENKNVTEQTVETAAESGNIMQHIQDMIGDLLKNAVDKMQKTETGEQLGGVPAEAGSSELPTQMGMEEVKGFVNVMQKFIDNVNVMILQLETGSSEHGCPDEKFLDGYMATADNVLEIAAFSMKDPLTGLSNRYGFDNRLVLEWNRAIRDKSALSLVIFGVNCSKCCEDQESVDKIMKAVSEILEKTIKRATDFMARWADDEFASLLPITGLEGATIVAERIQKELGEIDIPEIGEKGCELSVSIGVCVQIPEPNEKPVDFINRAYDAYTKAKETDDNTIVFA